MVTDVTVMGTVVATNLASTAANTNLNLSAARQTSNYVCSVDPVKICSLGDCPPVLADDQPPGCLSTAASTQVCSWKTLTVSTNCLQHCFTSNSQQCVRLTATWSPSLCVSTWCTTSCVKEAYRNVLVEGAVRQFPPHPTWGLASYQRCSKMGTTIPNF